MIWLLVPVVIFVICFYRWVIRDYMDGRGFGLFITLCATVISLFVALIPGGIICASLFDQRPVKVAEQSLITIRDKEGVAGSFFLGTGSFENKPYYFYYVKLTNGGARPDRLEANSRVTIFEEDRTDAKLVWWEYQYDMREVKKGLAWWFAIPIKGSNQAWAFHVPKGTIRTGFSM